MLNSNRDESPVHYAAVTDSEGHFIIEGVRAGRFDMRVTRSGYVSKSYGEDDEGRSSTVLNLKPAQQMTDLIFRLQRCGVISGHVLDEDGDPAQGVPVQVLQRRTSGGNLIISAFRQARTNDLGEYRVFDLRPGRYLVRADPLPGFEESISGTLTRISTTKPAGAYASTYYPNASDSSRGSVIELKPGDEVSGIDISLVRQKSYRVRGRVFNSVTEKPSSQIIVQLMPEDIGSGNGKNIPNVTVNEKTGEFEFDYVSGGRYAVLALLADGADWFSGSASVEIDDTSVDDVRVVITRGTDVRVKIVVEGKGVTPGELSVGVEPKEFRQFGAARTADASSDGAFLLRGLADGLYEIEVSSQCDVCFLKAATANGVDFLERGLEISSGSAPSSIELIYSSNSGTLDGTVAKDDGLPAAGAEVVLVPDHVRQGTVAAYPEESADQYGHFEMKGVPPGSYHAFAWQSVDRDGLTDPEFLKPFERQAQSVSIGENEKKSVQLTLIVTPSTSQ